MISRLGDDSGGSVQSARMQRRRLGAELTLAERDAQQCHELHERQENHAQALCSHVLHELFEADASIYTKLAARLRSCRPEHGDLQALAPCAEVDALLSRVVSIIQGDYAAHTSDLQRHAAPHAHAADMELLVRVALEQRIAAEPALRARARCVRRSAGLAETAMEQHYSRVLLAELQAIREPFALPPAGRMRTARLESCLALAKFPYARNYRTLTLAELRLLRQPAPPLLLRAAHAARLPLLQRQRFELELAALRARSSAQAIWLSSEHSVAVCGSGPLPLSGLMLHTLTAARVSLIERDANAVAMSRALVRELERLQVLTSGAVEVVHADVAEHTPRAHVVLVASLVDQAAKLQLVQRLREQRSPLQALLLRSASSLCAELAYEPIDTLLFTDPSLPFVGECVPGAAAQQRSEQLVSSSREVLNDTELYRPVALAGADTGWLGERLVQLRAAAREELHD